MHKSRVQGGWNKKNQNITTSPLASKDAKLEFLPQNVALKIEDKIISQSGDYDLSITTNGPSYIHLNQEFYLPNRAYNLFDELSNTILWDQKFGLNDVAKLNVLRLVSWFGDMTYEYGNIYHQPNTEWNETILDIKSQLEAYCNNLATSQQTFSQNLLKAKGIDKVMGFRPHQLPIEFNSCLCNFYRNGKDSVDWHADKEPELGPYPLIASISLGEVRNFWLKRSVSSNSDLSDSQVESPKTKIPLNNGSLVIMYGAMQLDWLHSIPREYHDKGPRINLTFRYTYKQPPKL